MQPSWDDLFRDPRFHWNDPDQVVVEVAQRWREHGIRLIHDLGCGAGRHTAFLLTEGFEVVGSDLASHGLSACCERLAEAKLCAQLVLSDMSSLPFADGVFDATISINVLNHGQRRALQAAADEILRTLRPGARHC